MSVEVLENIEDVSPIILDESILEPVREKDEVDARRRLEDKIEDMRLRREIQEFDFDM